MKSLQKINITSGEQLQIEKNASASHTLVTGHSGAGKSTLAKSFGLPIHALDDDPDIRAQLKVQMAYAKENEGRLPLGGHYARDMQAAESKAIKRALALKEPHVIEGSYLLNRDPKELGSHTMYLVDTPENVVLDRRVERQRVKDLARGRYWGDDRAAGVRSRGQQLIDEYRPGVAKWRESDQVKKASAKRDYRKEYLRDHASPEAKANRVKRNYWNRKIKTAPGQEIDHKVPLSKGGSNDKSNLRITSVSANRSKGTKTASAYGHIAGHLNQHAVNAYLMAKERSRFRNFTREEIERARSAKQRAMQFAGYRKYQGQ